MRRVHLSNNRILRKSPEGYTAGRLDVTERPAYARAVFKAMTASQVRC